MTREDGVWRRPPPAFHYSRKVGDAEPSALCGQKWGALVNIWDNVTCKKCLEQRDRDDQAWDSQIPAIGERYVLGGSGGWVYVEDETGLGSDKKVMRYRFKEDGRVQTQVQLKNGDWIPTRHNYSKGFLAGYTEALKRGAR